jgi:Holliday junction resolvasome RuvABC DNA-binding subunit
MLPGEGEMAAGSNGELRGDAIGALTALGYRPKDAEKVVTSLIDQAETSEQLIKLALQAMSGGKK